MTMIWRFLKGRMDVLLAALLAALSFSDDARAQRIMDGQFFLGAEGRWPLGAAVGTGRYLPWGYWLAGVTADSVSKTLDAGLDSRTVSVDFWRTMAERGAMARLAATRSRSLSLYAGLTGGVSVKFFDPFRKISEDVVVISRPGRPFASARKLP